MTKRHNDTHPAVSGIADSPTKIAKVEKEKMEETKVFGKLS